MAVHRIRKGLDLPLAGEPAQAVDVAASPGAGRAARCRLPRAQADDAGRSRASACCAARRCSRTRRRPASAIVAPAAGTVAAIHRGEMRAFQSLVIDVDPDDGPDAQVAFASYAAHRPPHWMPTPCARCSSSPACGRRSARARSRECRRRPRSPHAIFVTAIDTQPHAPAVDVGAGRPRRAISTRDCSPSPRLCAGTTYVCKAAGSRVTAPCAERIVRRGVRGPASGRYARPAHPRARPGTTRTRPSGTSATRTSPRSAGCVTTGRLDVERVVSLAGPGAARPRLLRTRLGASIDDADARRAPPRRAARHLRLGARRPHRARATSTATSAATTCRSPVLPEGDERELFGWIAPRREQVLDLGRRPRPLGEARELPLTTTTNGSPRAMVPIGAYERVMPMDLMPTFLLRALITAQRRMGRGAWACVELDEEDLALCTFVCPGKFEYGPLLRDDADAHRERRGTSRA